MRISDWSSDVCSSDLSVHRFGIDAKLNAAVALHAERAIDQKARTTDVRRVDRDVAIDLEECQPCIELAQRQLAPEFILGGNEGRKHLAAVADREHAVARVRGGRGGRAGDKP